MKKYIQTREKEYFLHLFEQGIQNLTRQIAHLESSRAMMQKKIDLVKQVNHIDTSLIYIQYCPREYLKVNPNACGRDSERETLSALSDTIQYRIEHDLCLGRAIGGILPAEWMKSDRDPGYCGYYSELAPDAPPEEGFVKPEGNYMICYHKGDYHTTYLSYPRLLEYAGKNHFRIGEYVYEESLIDEVVELDPDHWITKISVPFTVEQEQI